MNLRNFGSITIDVDEILSAQVACGAWRRIYIHYRNGERDEITREGSEDCRFQSESFDLLAEAIKSGFKNHDQDSTMNKPTKYERVIKKIIRLTENGEIRWTTDYRAGYLEATLYFSSDRNALVINGFYSIDIPRELSIKLANTIQHQLFPEIDDFIDKLLNENDDE